MNAMNTPTPVRKQMLVEHDADGESDDDNGENDDGDDENLQIPHIQHDHIHDRDHDDDRDDFHDHEHVRAHDGENGEGV